jgi:hypothetical protein
MEPSGDIILVHDRRIALYSEDKIKIRSTMLEQIADIFGINTQ